MSRDLKFVVGLSGTNLSAFLTGLTGAFRWPGQQWRSATDYNPT